jgi:DNA polymerase-3 subunit delta
MFQSLGATVTKKVVSELVGITGFDPLDRLRTDIEMIAAAAGSEPITSELVRELATHSDDMKIFAVTDAWATRNKSELLRTVEHLLQQNEKPVPLTIILGRHIAQVAKARRLLNHLPSGAVVNELTTGGANAWAAKKATEQAGRIGLAQAEAALARIAQLDYELKGGAVSVNETSLNTIFTRGIAEL